MKGKNDSYVSQKVLVQVLVEEIEILKRTKEDYKSILSKTSDHLKRLEDLYNRPIDIDLSPLQKEHSRIRDTLKRFITFPVWLWVTFSISTVVLCLSLCYNYYQHKYITSLEKNYRYYYKAYKQLSSKQKK